MQKYLNRREAGAILAEALRGFANNINVIILALPRGGVPVAYEVSEALHAPLDVYIVRKLGVPGHHELAMGAIAQGGKPVFNKEIVDHLRVSKDEIDAVIANETAELKRREKVYRGDKPFPSLQNKIVILIDDGIATGATMKAAMMAVRQHEPQQVVVAVPVADVSVAQEFSHLADEFVCPMIVDNLHAVGLWYSDFSQTEDDEVRQLLGSNK